jgi:hypothetical protein
VRKLRKVAGCSFCDRIHDSSAPKATSSRSTGSGSPRQSARPSASA